VVLLLWLLFISSVLPAGICTNHGSKVMKLPKDSHLTTEVLMGSAKCAQAHAHPDVSKSAKIKYRLTHFRRVSHNCGKGLSVLSCLSVHPPAMNSSAATLSIFMKIGICRKTVEKMQV